MLGHPGVFVVGGHFDEPIRVPVGFRPQSALFLGPVPESVSVQPGANLLPERTHCEHGLSTRGRTALNRGTRHLGTREGSQRYPVFGKNEASEDLAAQSAAFLARGRHHGF